ncbi:Uu.00g065360.m01.CDS01 [Anthostomella pinea]|uniref:Uu.00g065360.m01.CDS01 n=1 Tax=Anthostomella pinea TaxID=933095 RepID=A0AAI8YNA8_9PEZI|nr:Uu.00g065360.m01.CDS01 [Anthostomella pinea]
MAQPSPVEAQVAVTQVPELGPDVFTNEHKADVPSPEACWFRSDICVYIAMISFQKRSTPASNVFTYGLRMPKIEVEPEDIPIEAVAQLNDSQVNQAGEVLQSSKPVEEPFDWRPIGILVGNNPTAFRLRGFVRAQPLSATPASAHLAALAYASDEKFLGVALHANPDAAGKGGRNVGMVTSLTHNISFHDPTARADRWMVAERKTTWGADERVNVQQLLWDRGSGRLLMTVQQEALVRLRNGRL